MSVYDGYAKQLDEDALIQQESIDKSTKAQLDALEENRKLVEAEKQNAFRGAYVDYAKNINPYGVQSELAYGAGLGGAGKGETAQANFYNAYQGRLGEINTTATDQLRDIAQQESAARLAGDQAKMGVVSQTNQMKAAARLEDARLQEQYAREDKANAYNQLLTAISSAGYTPTDAELATAGMTRDMANSYKAAYNQQLAASYRSSGGSQAEDPVTTSLEDIDVIRSNLATYRDGGNTKAMGNYLDQLVAAKTISEEVADALYAEYIVYGNVRPGQGRSVQNNLYDPTIKAVITG